MHKKHLFYLALLFFITIAPVTVFAQPPPPDDCPGFPNCVPIDGGLGFLIAAGVALVGKKLWNANKVNP